MAYLGLNPSEHSSGVAIARELVGFIWAIARLIEPKAARQA
jgi:hypothetical protein